MSEKARVQRVIAENRRARHDYEVVDPQVDVGECMSGGGDRAVDAVVDHDVPRGGDRDGTRDELLRMASRSERVRLVLAQPLLYPGWSRTQRLALCRNVLLAEALSAAGVAGVSRPRLNKCSAGAAGASSSVDATEPVLSATRPPWNAA